MGRGGGAGGGHMSRMACHSTSVKIGLVSVAGVAASASRAFRRSSVSGWLEKSARARENASSLATRSSRSTSPLLEKPRRMAVLPGECVGLGLGHAREAIIDEVRADRGRRGDAGHIAKHKANEQAGGGTGDQRFHTVAVVDVADSSCARTPANSSRRACRLDQCREVIGAAAGQREGVWDVRADHCDMRLERRIEAVEDIVDESTDRKVGDRVWIGIADDVPFALGHRRLDLRRRRVADLDLPRRRDVGDEAVRQERDTVEVSDDH